jgi:hypothetical protein
MKNIRTDHEVRLKAFDHMDLLRKQGIIRKDIIDFIHNKYKIPIMTLYSWYSKRKIWGRKGKIIYNPELLYVLGALLGDGCSYRWKPTINWNILVGDNEFTTKYASYFNKCTNQIVKPYIIRSKNIWFVRSNNYNLYELFEKIRNDYSHLIDLVDNNKKNAFLFIEGFFDAEGCVKIINDKFRKTPKICLDITNTNFEVLEIVRMIFKEIFNIEARYSIQKSFIGKDGYKRKTCYHLRIYKKEYVRIFFDKVSTTKLSATKAKLLCNWLNNRK